MVHQLGSSRRVNCVSPSFAAGAKALQSSRPTAAGYAIAEIRPDQARGEPIRELI